MNSTEDIIQNWKDAFIKCNAPNGYKLPDIVFENGLYKISSVSIFGERATDVYSEEKIKKMTKNLLDRCQ